MRSTVLAVSLTLAAVLPASAAVDITSPGDTVYAIHNGGHPNHALSPDLGTGPFNDPGPGYPSANPASAVVDDNLSTKYRNFGIDGWVGLIITPNVGPTVLKGLRVATADDAPDRDPTGFSIEGTNDADPTSTSAVWTGIAWGSLGLTPDPGRSAWGVQNSANDFPENMASYTSYRLILLSLRGASTADSYQISEIALLGVVPEPGVLALVSAAGTGLLLRRRR